MAIPTTGEEFLALVRKSGLVAPKNLDEYLQRWQGGKSLPAVPDNLAKKMVQDGLLTSLQTSQLLKGKWKNFVLAGKYKLLEHLGGGGMGQVYLCEHVTMRRRVALKVLPTGKNGGVAILERFRREARAVAALDHPNIVRAYDLDHAGDLHFLVMEYVEGSSLQQIVATHGPLSVGRAVHYVRQAAEGLQHAFEAGLIHRDVKPANLLLDRGGTVKVLDLGLARFQSDQADQITKQHDSNTVLGTIDYLAPEQALNAAVDIRADVYSLGMTFYFLLTGHTPFEGGTARQKLLWHQAREPKPVTELRPEVPRLLAEVLEKMIAKDPAKRYQTPAEVGEALSPWAPDTLPPPPEKEMPRLSPAARDDSTIRLATKSTIRVRPSGVGKPSRGRFLDQVRDRFRAQPVLFGSAAAGFLLVLIGGFFLIKGLFSGSPSPSPTPPRGGGPSFEQVAGATEVFRFTGHEQGIDRVDLTRDGRLALSAGYDSTARLWDLSNGRELFAFRGHTDQICFAAFAFDGRRGVTAGADGTIRVWDIPGRKELQTIPAHDGRVWSAVFSPDGQFLLSGGMDRVAKLWRAADSQLLKTFEGHQDAINCVAFSPDGKKAATASWDKSVRLWDVASGTEIKHFDGHTKGASAVTFSANGSQVLSCGYDGTVRLWDATSGKQLHVYSSGTEQLWFAAFSPDGQRVAACGQNPVIRVWDLASERLLNKVEGHSNGVTSVRWLPDGRMLSSSQDKTLRLWQLP
jgi:WD40 repeat protein